MCIKVCWYLPLKDHVMWCVCHCFKGANTRRNMLVYTFKRSCDVVFVNIVNKILIYFMRKLINLTCLSLFTNKENRLKPRDTEEFFPMTLLISWVSVTVFMSLFQGSLLWLHGALQGVHYNETDTSSNDDGVTKVTEEVDEDDGPMTTR